MLFPELVESHEEKLKRHLAINDKFKELREEIAEWEDRATKAENFIRDASYKAGQFVADYDMRNKTSFKFMCRFF